MKKRQTLFLNKNPYDLLLFINHTILDNHATVEIPRDGHYDKECVNACVLDCFMESQKVYKRCQFMRMDCERCLQEFLNEED